MFLLMAINLSAVRSRFWLFLPALLWYLFLLLLPEVITMALPKIEDPFAQAMLMDHAEHFSWGYRVFFIAALLFTVLCVIDKRYHSGDKVLMHGLVSVLGLSLFLLPVVGEIKQGPIKEAANLAIQADYKVVRWKLNTPSFSVYSQQVMERRRPSPGEVVLTKNKYLQDLQEYEVLYQRGGVVMAKVIK
jgi:uncharacterized membrane protein YhaH (DUF805 family)